MHYFCRAAAWQNNRVIWGVLQCTLALHIVWGRFKQGAGKILGWPLATVWALRGRGLAICLGVAVDILS